MVVSRRELLALLHYRFSHALRQSQLPPRVRRGGLLGMAAARRAVELYSGVSLPDTASVGPGLRFAHPGMIVINGSAVIGRDCLICHGVTIGASTAGTPVLGDGVYLGTNAVVAGNVHVGDAAVVSANTLVIRDVPAGQLAAESPRRTARAANQKTTPTNRPDANR